MNQTQKQELHLVLGGGQIGTQLAKALLSQGHAVRLVNRSAKPFPEGASGIVADVSDLSRASELGQGASVVYQCMNPAYPFWQTELPRITEGAIAIAKANNAKLVVLDCLYEFGPMHGVPMSDQVRGTPSARKGVLRKEMADRLLKAHQQGEVRVTIGRASDYVGPGIVTAHFGERFWQRIFKSQNGECMGDPSLPHAFTYGPDVVRALISLGAEDQALGKIWNMPTLPAQSMNDWANAFGKAIQQKISIGSVPRIVLRAMGIFMPMMRELVELRYQWAEPYRLDDSSFVQTFGWTATPFETQVRETSSWALSTYKEKELTAAA